MPHLWVRRLKVDVQVFVSQHFTCRRANRSYNRVPKTGAYFICHAKFIGQFQQVEKLIAGSEHEDIRLSSRDPANVSFERAAVDREVPIVNMNRVDSGSSSFQSSDQASIRDAVF